MSPGLPVRILSGTSVLALAAVAGIGVNRLTSSSPVFGQVSGREGDKNITLLSNELRWLESADQDKEIWDYRVKNYGSSGTPTLDGYKPKEGEDKSELMKKACDDLKKGNFSKEDLDSKKKQAEWWCSTFKTIDQLFEGKERLSFNVGDTNTDGSTWSSKFLSYILTSEKLFGLDLSGKTKVEGIIELKKKCEESLRLNASKENIYLFKKWCSKN